MAQMIPANVNQIREASTQGEKRLYDLLKDHTSEDWICYAKQRIKNNGTPDFLIIAPDLGILVLEEKSISIDQVVQASTETSTVVRNGTPSEETHPLRQARENIKNTLGLVKRVARLKDENGRLRFPYGHGVILSNITRAQLQDATLFSQGLETTFSPELVICQDEMPDESKNPSDFQSRLRKMTSYFRFEPLNEDDTNSIRAVIYPDLLARRLGDWLNDRNAQMQALSIEQEQMARGMGNRDKLPHRLIRGVVGSGKTIVLLFRARMLAEENKNWRILVTFFTRPLIGSMKKNMPPNVYVGTLGQAMYRHWRGCNPSDPFPDPDSEDNWKEMVKAFADGRLKKGVYDAIFLDEAQDLTPAQADCLRHLLNEETNCAMFCGDGAQNIFNRNVVWKAHGFNFHGRSTRKDFLINYRNTFEIYEFAQKLLAGNGHPSEARTQEDDDNLVACMAAECKRHGPTPRAVYYTTEDAECRAIMTEINRLLQTQGIFPASIAIIIPYATSRNSAKVAPYLQALQQLQIPYYWLSENQKSKSNYDPDENLLVISTPESSKGLEWDIVFAPSLNSYYSEKAEILHYVAATRAREILYPSEVKNGSARNPSNI